MGFVNLVPSLSERLLQSQAHPLLELALLAPETALVRLPLRARAWHLQGFLGRELTQYLRETGIADTTLPVGLDGIAAHYREGGPIGSWRASIFDERLAQHFWQRLPDGFRHVHCFDAAGSSDWDGHCAWRPDGVNPLCRYIRYQCPQGQLVAHYDAPYVDTPARRSLWSLLVYLTDNEDGATRFLRDPQESLPFSRRDFRDQQSVGKDSDVLFATHPKAGDALLFEHRILHDSQPIVRGADKLVLRTDLMFSKVALS